LLETLLPLLTQFLEGKTDLLSKSDSLGPRIYYYFKEIIRYWNKLNFILLRISTGKTPPISLQANCLYAIFRFLYEKTPIETIFNELVAISKTSSEKKILRSFLGTLRTFDWEQAIKGKSDEEILSLEAAIPTFVIQKLCPVMSFEFLKQNLQYMNDITRESTQSLRINTLRAEAEGDVVSQIESELKQQGIEFHPDSNIPELYHISNEKKSIILQNHWYRSGHLIFQDKASAAVVSILDPQPNELICDLCAAPGIKTSLIAQNTNNTAQIFAIDVQTQRTNQLKQLLHHLNVSGVGILNTDGLNLPFRSSFHFDKVLLDAPCTGSGTFLTNPELKWRQNQKFLQQNCYFQSKLLETAMSILKPGGILVYSTCSLYPEEGELQILKFKDTLLPLSLPNWISACYQIDESPLDGMGRLFPAIHQTQGFFVTKLQKVD